jgi:hypothetical protein
VVALSFSYQPSKSAVTSMAMLSKESEDIQRSRFKKPSFAPTAFSRR